MILSNNFLATLLQLYSSLDPWDSALMICWPIYMLVSCSQHLCTLAATSANAKGWKHLSKCSDATEFAVSIFSKFSENMGYLSDRQFNSTLTRVFKVSGKWLNASPGSSLSKLKTLLEMQERLASSRITARCVTDECCHPASQVSSITHIM